MRYIRNLFPLCSLCFLLLVVGLYPSYGQQSFSKAEQNAYLQKTYGLNLNALEEFYAQRDEIFLRCKNNQNYCIETALINFLVNPQIQKDVFLLSLQIYFERVNSHRQADIAIGFNLICENQQGKRYTKVELVVGNEILNMSMGNELTLIISDHVYYFTKVNGKFILDDNKQINKIVDLNLPSSEDIKFEIQTPQIYRGVLKPKYANIPADIIHKMCFLIH